MVCADDHATRIPHVICKIHQEVRRHPASNLQVSHRREYRRAQLARRDDVEPQIAELSAVLWRNCHKPQARPEVRANVEKGG